MDRFSFMKSVLIMLATPKMCANINIKTEPSKSAQIQTYKQWNWGCPYKIGIVYIDEKGEHTIVKYISRK